MHVRLMFHEMKLIMLLVALLSVFILFSTRAHGNIPPDAEDVAQWTKQMIQGNEASRANIIAYANDPTKDNLVRQIALRSLGVLVAPENIDAIKPFLLSPSDSLRTAAYFALPENFRSQIAFDYSRQPTQQEYDAFVAQIDALLFTDLLPAMQANRAPSPYVLEASSEDVAAGMVAYKAFDDVLHGSMWRPGPSLTTGWLKIDMGAANKSVVSRYAITAMGETAPKSWTFEGSNDGANWNVLATVTGFSIWDASLRTFYFTSSSTAFEYRFFRINITENNGGNALEVVEVNLFLL